MHSKSARAAASSVAVDLQSHPVEGEAAIARNSVGHILIDPSTKREARIRAREFTGQRERMVDTQIAGRGIRDPWVRPPARGGRRLQAEKRARSPGRGTPCQRFRWRLASEPAIHRRGAHGRAACRRLPTHLAPVEHSPAPPRKREPGVRGPVTPYPGRPPHAALSSAASRRAPELRRATTSLRMSSAVCFKPGGAHPGRVAVPPSNLQLSSLHRRIRLGRFPRRSACRASRFGAMTGCIIPWGERRESSQRFRRQADATGGVTSRAGRSPGPRGR